MGNSGSQNQQVTTKTIPEEQWAHSFPRTYNSQPKLPYQHKVLPEKSPQLKLRPTNNGEILQSGGTIRGRRRNSAEGENKRFSHDFESLTFNGNREYDRDICRIQAIQGVQRKLINNVSGQQMKFCSSEPDLRYVLRKEESPEKKSKKKYKAPSPPKKILDEYLRKTSQEDMVPNPNLPIRKARLFKTRVETKKQSSHLKENSEHDSNTLDCPINHNSKVANSKRFSLPEVKLIDSNAFSRELKDVTQRFRYEDKDKKTSSYDCHSSDRERNKLKINVVMTEDENIIEPKITPTRGEASGKESTSPEMSPTPKPRYQSSSSKDPPKPKQVFYFGMNENARDTEDTFFNTIRDKQDFSASEISSDIDSEEYDVFKTGIDLQLRPILPKKPLEIPRFSPAAAWRLLTLDTIEDGKATRTPTTTASSSGAGAVEGITSFGGTIITDDVPLLLEEHIEKYSRPLPPHERTDQTRSCNDKSGDSGISGDDAVPIVYCYDNDGIVDEDERFGNMLMHQNKTKSTKKIDRERASWTPQQDLDDSSADEDILNKQTKPKLQPHAGPHVFSLSLPRESHLATYVTERVQYNGMQKFKKSLTSAWGNLSHKKDYFQHNSIEENGDNWFLSKSAPNSLVSAIHSLERYKTIENRYPLSPPNGSSAARVMYLPETNSIPKLNNKKKFGMSPDHSYKSLQSKSCENISSELRKRSPEQLQDPKPFPEQPTSWKKRKPKKYTFQSTIRQIEKKRLSDKLSREAEMRERERIRELAAMQKVEEEFQRKRASEKANIRHQLRLFSLDESKGCQSLPNFQIKNKQDRTEPDGAFSSVSSSSISSTSSSSTSLKNAFFNKMSRPKVYSIDSKLRPSSTKELSEFRQVQRDYKDYSSSLLKHTSEKRYASKQTTVHPRISCNMPQIKGLNAKGNPNYRRDFASGIKSASTDSNHSEGSFTMQHYSRRR